MMELAIGRILCVVMMLAMPAGESMPRNAWTGWISDSACRQRGVHGRDDPGFMDCARKCIEGGHKAVLVPADNNGTILTIANTKAVLPYAGRYVTLEGTLDVKTSTITVTKVTPLNKK
jgi:hypothetical protein